MNQLYLTSKIFNHQIIDKMTTLQRAINNLQPITISFLKQASDVVRFFENQRNTFLETLNADFNFPKMIGAKWHKDKSLFRVTTPYKNIAEFTKVSDFHNPCACKTELNRCNYPFYPVFYVSSTAVGALTETIQKKENKLIVGSDKLTYFLTEWEIESNNPLTSIAFLNNSIPADHPWKQVQENFYTEVCAKLKQYSKDEWNEILNIIANDFCKKGDDENLACDYYKLSAYLSHSMLYNEDCVDYLV